MLKFIPHVEMKMRVRQPRRFKINTVYTIHEHSPRKPPLYGNVLQSFVEFSHEIHLFHVQIVVDIDHISRRCFTKPMLIFPKKFPFIIDYVYIKRGRQCSVSSSARRRELGPVVLGDVLHDVLNHKRCEAEKRLQLSVFYTLAECLVHHFQRCTVLMVERAHDMFHYIGRQGPDLHRTD